MKKGIKERETLEELVRRGAVKERNNRKNKTVKGTMDGGGSSRKGNYGQEDIKRT